MQGFEKDGRLFTTHRFTNSNVMNKNNSNFRQVWQQIKHFKKSIWFDLRIEYDLPKNFVDCFAPIGIQNQINRWRRTYGLCFVIGQNVFRKRVKFGQEPPAPMVSLFGTLQRYLSSHSNQMCSSKYLSIFLSAGFFGQDTGGGQNDSVGQVFGQNVYRKRIKVGRKPYLSFHIRNM